MGETRTVVNKPVYTRHGMCIVYNSDIHGIHGIHHRVVHTHRDQVNPPCIALLHNYQGTCAVHAYYNYTAGLQGTTGLQSTAVYSCVYRERGSFPTLMSEKSSDAMIMMLDPFDSSSISAYSSPWLTLSEREREKREREVACSV